MLEFVSNTSYCDLNIISHIRHPNNLITGENFEVNFKNLRAYLLLEAFFKAEKMVQTSEKRKKKEKTCPAKHKRNFLYHFICSLEDTLNKTAEFNNT